MSEYFIISNTYLTSSGWGNVKIISRKRFYPKINFIRKTKFFNSQENFTRAENILRVETDGEKV